MLTKQTTKERLIHMCISCGMFENQALEVVNAAIPEINEISKTLNGETLNENLEVVPNDPYVITWDSPHDQYHRVMYDLWFKTVKKHAIAWIDANKPQAWFRPMFL